MNKSVLVVLSFVIQGCGGPCEDLPQAPVRIDFPNTVLAEKAFSFVDVLHTCREDAQVEAVVSGDPAFALEETVDALVEGENSFVVSFTADGYGERVADFLLDTSVGEVAMVLTGNANPDQDGDGVNAVEAGGEDCDDSNKEIVAPVAEIVNGQDDDCDGLVDEDFVGGNEILITELMLSPSSVAAPAGQWVEIRNESSRTLDLSGWTLSAPNAVWTVAEGVRISGRQTRVLGFEADTTKNGGVTVDGLLTGPSLPLPNQAFYVSLAVAGRTVAVVSDKKWPDASGASVSLDPLILDPAEAARADAWCNATSALPSGDRATPGAANDPCPQFDHDGDGLTGLDGDCDDTRADVSPIAADVWDGFDNNCDGFTDLMLLPTGTNGQVRGSMESLGRDVEVADWNGDGVVEAMVIAGQNTTRAYRVPAVALFGLEPVRVADVGVGLVQEASGTGQRGSITGVASPVDIDGDKDAELVVLGRAANFYSGGTRFDYLWIYEDLPDSMSAPLTGASALLTVNDPLDGFSSDGVEALFDGDMDGDGKAELVFGHGSYKGGTSGTEASCNGKVWVLDLEGKSGRLTATDVDRASWTGTNKFTSIGDALEGGDVNDDGYDDVIVMDLDKQRSLTSRRVQVIPGSASLPAETTVEAVTPLTITGLTRTGNGWNDLWAPVYADLDRDGTGDLAIPDPGGLGVAIFYDVASLSGEVPVTSADATISGPGGFGSDLAWGDVDGDGVGDLLVGAPSNSPSGNGRAFLFDQGTFAAGAVSYEEAWAGFGTGSSGGFGARVKLFDLDADGDSEVLIPDGGSFNGDGGVFVYRAP